jgi:hypothetical protein
MMSIRGTAGGVAQNVSSLLGGLRALSHDAVWEARVRIRENIASFQMGSTCWTANAVSGPWNVVMV